MGPDPKQAAIYFSELFDRSEGCIELRFIDAESGKCEQRWPKTFEEATNLACQVCQFRQRLLWSRNSQVRAKRKEGQSLQFPGVLDRQ